MRIWAIAKRIILEFLRDKRSMALLFIVPLFIMTLLWLVFNGNDYEPTIAVSSLPAPLEKALEKQDATLKNMAPDEARKAMQDEEIDAFVQWGGKTINVTVEGSDSTATSAVQKSFITGFRGTGFA
ncbi:hypothetical protein RWE15_06450 [Virgibacillus halophilus]|uniref:ABC transporter permease n=1 Tax=Tigheibacillus halophilus TaxID=361280 RepID=A0ABU5C4N9_9BACI|nr:hypothetical protein [Virgibacillus halophilus]